MFSGTPCLSGVKYLLSDIAVNTNGRVIMIADITGAFLYGRVTRDVNVELPGETGLGKDRVGRLKKSLYGLRDAPQIWKCHLVATLKRDGFEESATIPGMLRHSARGLKVAAHVDDLLVTGPGRN